MIKIFSIVRWAIVMLVNLLFFLLAHIVYPILYPFRNLKLMNYIPFWWFFDDEDGNYGTDWFRDSLEYGNKTDWFSLFRIAYKWSAMRNPSWNLQASLLPKEGYKVLLSSSGSAVRGGIVVSPFLMCGFKYENENGKYTNNIGDYLSLTHSILGRQFAWYKVEGVTYWRFSYANELFKNVWVEFQIGTNNQRYTWRLKIKRNLKVR